MAVYRKIVFPAALLFIAGGVQGVGFEKNIVGYFTSWSVYVRNYHVTDIPADRVNYINYAFANINPATGEIVLGDAYADIDKWYPGDSSHPDSLRGSFHQLQILKAENPHIRTLISVGGWTWSTYFSDIALTPVSRETFALSCVQFIQEYDFDGVDIDWEYPVEGGLPGNIYRPEDKENFTALLAELRYQLDIAGDDYLLTVATTASPVYIENIEPDQIHQYLDWINVMTYDFHGPWGGESDAFTNFNSPLYMNPEDPLGEPYHSFFNLSAAIEGYIGKGVPAQKIHAGIPFYGRGYANVENENNGLYVSYSGPAVPGTWEPGCFDYWDLSQNYIDKNGYVSYWQNDAQVPWLYNPTEQKMITYDDPRSIVAKAEFINSLNLGGAMFWEFQADKYSELLDSLYLILNDSLQTAVGDSNGQPVVPGLIRLNNYPNPFRQSTTIEFSLPYASPVKLRVYDASGRIVSTLSSSNCPGGMNYIIWNGVDDCNRPLPSGVYHCHLSTEDTFINRRLLMMH
ncbi:MAG: T9SS type A sorting domain-containing protein [Candidatus Aegiribacteria sp.]|nr:T9SS type A sorting domain-containing protein [Candidatus Aegiribacteria sp.]